MIKSEHTHSRVTASLRLLLALWLIVTAAVAQSDPPRAVETQDIPLSMLLPLTGLTFTLGVFLLTGFMSRVAGLVLVCLGVWQAFNLRQVLGPAVYSGIGIYLMLRGGGAWAMDIYVQRMQERARRKALSPPES